MELNAGMYVRTKEGIGKILPDAEYDAVLMQDDNRRYRVDKNGTVLSQNNFNQYIWSNDVIEASLNIIDLVEEGDYVNGEEVFYTQKTFPRRENKNNENDVIFTKYYDDEGLWCGYEKNEIKTVVTKEQMKNMEYRVGE